MLSRMKQKDVDVLISNSFVGTCRVCLRLLSAPSAWRRPGGLAWVREKPLLFVKKTEQRENEIEDGRMIRR